jgi:hypothetical protein
MFAAHHREEHQLSKHKWKNFLTTEYWLVVVLCCYALLAWVSWGKIDNPVIDIGREMEIPARLATGEILYRDVETYYGPLAYYINALALLIFGHRIEVFYVISLCLIFLITLLYYRLAKLLTSGVWAALSTVCMLIYCAFSSDLYHFLFPYSYGAVYAIALCFVAFNALERYIYKSKITWLVIAAIACGLAGIAKQEYGVAALAGILIAVNLYSPLNFATKVKHNFITIVVAGVCALIPLAVIAQQASWENIYSLLFPISKLSVIKQSDLFQVSPAKTLRWWFVSFAIFLAGSAIVGIAVIVSHSFWQSRRFIVSQRLKNFLEFITTLAGVLIGLNLLLVLYPVKVAVFNPLGNLSWSLPVLVIWYFFITLKLTENRNIPLISGLLGFSLLLNARWLFYINFYGLYAATVILLFFVMLYQLTQRYLLVQRFSVILKRSLFFCLLIAAIIQIENLGNYHYAVNSSVGTFYTWHPERARAFNQTINAVKEYKASSVLVLPEGNLINFLTATHSPSKEMTFLPLTLPTKQAEKDFLTRMQLNPPQLIVYVDRNFPEYGYQDYAEFDPLVARWITQQHQLLETFPKDEGAIRIYSRNSKF